MKKLAVYIVIAVSVIATSCLGGGSSTTDYTMNASFDEYATSDVIEQYFNDSLCFLEHINIDMFSYLNANYADSVFGGGFCLSLKKDSLNTDGSVSEYSSCGPSAGALNSTMYAVYSGDGNPPTYGFQINLSGFSIGTCSMVGFYINNVSKTIKAIEDNPLQKGDYLKVNIIGYLNSQTTNSVSVYLVNYSELSPTIITSWSEVDLSSLSFVDALQFVVETNRDDFPKNFCMDNLLASVHIEV